MVSNNKPIRQQIIDKLNRSGKTRDWLRRHAGLGKATVYGFCNGSRDVGTEQADLMLRTLYTKAKKE